MGSKGSGGRNGGHTNINRYPPHSRGQVKLKWGVVHTHACTCLIHITHTCTTCVVSLA